MTQADGRLPKSSESSHPDPNYKPLIGITGRRLAGTALPDLEQRYQRHDFGAYFTEFPSAITAAGGIAVEIPYESGHADLVARLDGVLITGGQDVHPERWGGDPACAVGPVDTARDDHEAALIRAALDSNVPLLGVCRGMQLINVVLGGTLVPDLDKSCIDHTANGHETSDRVHTVRTAPDSLAHSLFGAEVAVNSLHHQAVAHPGRGVVVTGRAADGTPEIIELPGSAVLGVQWHPEWLPGVEQPFHWLVRTAQDYAYACGPRTARELQRTRKGL